ncbi:hypothetical protein VaNZ11_001857 [Volvox africanus]|uniref:Uncharacterized protein n=1 Tax=Volvox africanus TaxID=51714 RepID=A0ABQ5RQL4_9CHLO|nr:hypothetical protein VaNZ11_001857 [Volvox africanus]
MLQRHVSACSSLNRKTCTFPPADMRPAVVQRSITTKCRSRLEIKMPHKAGTRAPSASYKKSHLGAGQLAELGWMWQMGNNSTAGGSQTACASPSRMPCAVSTITHLYEDRFKAKKSLREIFPRDDGVLQNI